MTNRRALWGWVLIMGGLLWWMGNMGWIRLPWEKIGDLWPVILIGGGVTILPTPRPVKMTIGLICLVGVMILLYLAQQEEVHQMIY